MESGILYSGFKEESNLITRDNRQKTNLHVVKNDFARSAETPAVIHRPRNRFLRVLLPVLGSAAFLFLWLNAQGYTVAVDVTYKAHDVGYVKSQADVKSASQLVKSQMVEADTADALQFKPSYSVVLVKEDEVMDKEEMADAIVDLSQTLTPAEGLYVDGNFYGAVESEEALGQVLSGVLEEHKTGDKQEQVAFATDVEVVSGIYPSDRVVDTSEMEQLVKTQQPIPVEVKRMETVAESIPYETQILESDAYAQGTEMVIQEGEPGEATTVFSVTTLGDVEQSRKELTKTINKKPVTEQIVRGKAKAEEAPAAADTSESGFIWPLASPVISSTYGYRWGSLHSGLDICDSNWETAGKPVYAAAGGTVVAVESTEESGGYGNLIQIDHGNGVTTLYAHNDSVAVSVGQVVGRGEVIAYAGSTGYSTGAHLHFEVRVDDEPQDPMAYLPEIGVEIQE